MGNNKLVKVCGMREEGNIRDILATGTDWIGLVFYPRSPRYVSDSPAFVHEKFVYNGRKVRKVGVFVNATFEQMMEKVNEYNLDYVQLHGNESPDACYALQKRGVGVIKAFPVTGAADLEATHDYEGRVDYFLFDTRCESYGGSGEKFDWSVLAAYQGETPFLLSGGLNPESLPELEHFSHPGLAGVDLNSGFERSPGYKDAGALDLFITNYKKQKHE